MPRTHSILVADVGGTKTRLAVARDGKLGKIDSKFNDSVPNLSSLLEQELAGLGKDRPRCAVLAVAAPMDGDEVKLTNRNWSFSRAKLKRSLKLDRLIVVNDFAAVAYALPALRTKDLMRIGGGDGKKNGNLLACGPGTGFGVAALIRDREKDLIVPSEAGHMILGPSVLEKEIFDRLLPRPKPLVIENILSGPGLAFLHQSLSGQAATSDAVLAAAKAGDKTALYTAVIFLRFLGRIAGDLALAFDARGGVYIGGGVGRALAPLFAASPFRKTFGDRPTYGERLAAIPTYVVTHPSPELVGALRLGLEATR